MTDTYMSDYRKQLLIAQIIKQYTKELDSLTLEELEFHASIDFQATVDKMVPNPERN